MTRDRWPGNSSIIWTDLVRDRDLGVGNSGVAAVPQGPSNAIVRARLEVNFDDGVSRYVNRLGYSARGSGR